MSRDLRTPTDRAAAPAVAATPLGARLRQLRTSAGLTQTALAGSRFSKEYVSQIERGKTRPTRETIEWLAARLGVDPGYLENGVSADDRNRVEARVARAEALLESEQNEEALNELEALRGSVRALGLPEVEVRALKSMARAQVRLGAVREAVDVLQHARSLAEAPSCSDVERAEVLFILGMCRYLLNSVQTAVGLFDEALRMAERSDLPSDSLQSHIFSWRARCWRRQRDYEAAREDVERALQLAEGVEDPRTLGMAYFQASLIADREGHWVLARTYAERARAAFEEIADRTNVARLTNNLGALNFLLGNPEKAITQLKEAFRIALDVGNEGDAAQAVSSLAQVHLRTGDHTLAEEQARHALTLLDGREDFVDEYGNAQLVLGRALLEQGRLAEAEEAFRVADASFEQLGSASHRASAWMARGDLASKRGEHEAASGLYRRAAEALQDVRF
jgi:tetratricopeptide (TPR) repeat protein